MPHETHDTTTPESPGITQETAGKIWTAHREIANGNKLLEDLANREHGHDKHARRLPDAFGRPRLLQLGIPHGDSGHQLLGLQPDLAEAMIKAHIRDCESRLDGLNALARRELSKGELSAGDHVFIRDVVGVLGDEDPKEEV